MITRAKAIGPLGYGTYDVEWSGGPPRFTRVDGECDALVAPGFVDLHIHGAFGIDFMSATSDEMRTLCERLHDVGYEGFLPTTVSASAADVSRALHSLPAHEAILGFHLEGPFLSPDFPGAQPPEAIVDPPSSPSEWDSILDDPRLRIVTLAPERPGALPLIRRLAARGVACSMGHTAATYDEARAGWDAGVRHATHTFNAMRGLHHREPGALGFVLSRPEMVAELIYDREHVSPAAASILLRSKNPSHVVAVSDGTMASGQPDGARFTMWNHELEIQGGTVRLKGTNTLAGSAITLLDAFRNIEADFDSETAIRLCCLNPRRALGLASEPPIYVEFDGERNVVNVRRVLP